MTNSMKSLEKAYVVDTNALIWHLTKNARLSERVQAIFAAAARDDTSLVISAIVIAELYYANKKWRLFDDGDRVLSELLRQPYCEFVPFVAADVLDFTRDGAVPEMHDRIVAGLARRLGVPLPTTDHAIGLAGVVRVEW